MTPKGCHIEDIQSAPDSFELHRKVQAFLQVESVGLSPSYASVGARILRESGLEVENPATLIQMRVALEQYREFKRKQQK